MARHRPLTPEERRLGRVFGLGVGAFMVVGYALYFAALMLPPPAWAQHLIEALKPTLGGLVTAELVSNTPFAAQVLIAYSAIVGVTVLSVWASYIYLLNKESRAIDRQYLIVNSNNSRITLTALGCGMLLFVGMWIWFVAATHTDRGWQSRALLSSSFVSVTLQMLTAAMVGVGWTRALHALWIALTWHRSRDAMSRSSQSDHGG